MQCPNAAFLFSAVCLSLAAQAAPPECLRQMDGHVRYRASRRSISPDTAFFQSKEKGGVLTGVAGNDQHKLSPVTNGPMRDGKKP
jgi:hypothetical protein